MIAISLVYKDFEIFSGGETITVPRTEISNLAVFISFSAIQSNNVIFRREATLSGNTEHYFVVDSYFRYPQKCYSASCKIHKSMHEKFHRPSKILGPVNT